MCNTVWHNPVGAGYTPMKRLCLGINPNAIESIDLLLNAVAEGLKSMDAGQLWRCTETLLERPEVSHDATELTARATCPGGNGNTTIELQAVADYNVARTQLGLVMSYALFTDDVAFWKQQNAEMLVATSTLLTGDMVGRAAGYTRPANQDPTACWTWYNPSCGWMSRTVVSYGGWSIQLGEW